MKKNQMQVTIPVFDEPTSDYADQYGQWLKSRITQSVKDNKVEITTPQLDRWGDVMRVYVETRPEIVVIHDGGFTLRTLNAWGVYDLPKQIRKSLVAPNNRFKTVLNEILTSNDLAIVNGCIQTDANTENTPSRTHFLLSAMCRIIDSGYAFLKFNDNIRDN